MRPELQAKFLQHLNRKNKDGGFTLIELLVVIIIIGILAAIALPSFLSQANKGKQSEAKTYVGTLNKGQQAFYTEKGNFEISDISALGVGLKTETTNYTYSTVGTTDTSITGKTATNNASSKDPALKPYVGRVYLAQSGSSSEVTSIAYMCEEKVAKSGPTTALSATATECDTAAHNKL